MKKILKIKHWKVFIILTSSIIIQSLVLETNMKTSKLESLELAVIFRIIGLVTYFFWLLIVGLSLSSKQDKYFKLNKIAFIIAGLLCILGYSEMNLSLILNDLYSLPTFIDIVSTPLIVASIIYIFYSVSKLIKSTELKRNVMFKECILETFLLLMFPIGIWIIQPRLNKIFND